MFDFKVFCLKLIIVQTSIFNLIGFNSISNQDYPSHLNFYLETYADFLVFSLLECFLLGEGYVVLVWFYLLLFHYFYFNDLHLGEK